MKTTNLENGLCATMTTEMVVAKILNEQPEIHRDELVRIIAQTRDISEQTANTQLSRIARMVRDDKGVKIFVLKSSAPAPTKPSTPQGITAPAVTAPRAVNPDAHLITQWKGHKYIPLKRKDRKSDVDFIRFAYEHRNDPNGFYICMTGDTGCGKTMAVNHVCFEDGHRVVRVNLNGGTTIEDLVGQFVPTSIPGVLEWVDGVLTQAMRYGYWIILDELNFCPESIASILHPVLDDGRMLVLTAKDGEVIRAHKDFYVVGAYNPNYNGTRPLNEAFKNRFVFMTYEYNQLAEKQLLKGKEGLILYAEKVRARIRQGEIQTRLSTRELVRFAFLWDIIGLKTAIEAHIAGFEEDERLAIKEALENTLNIAPEDVPGADAQ